MSEDVLTHLLLYGDNTLTHDANTFLLNSVIEFTFPGFVLYGSVLFTNHRWYIYIYMVNEEMGAATVDSW